MNFIADFVVDWRNFANVNMRLAGYTGASAAAERDYFLQRNTGFATYARAGTRTPANEADGACDQREAAPVSPTALPAVAP